mmetsp:Transcript_21586/g.46761  ORF Transcript_21586/g.46761 Transcript_21586/m.46761 type:complete len:390 (+) Transcript_21586:116-1285(+)
MSQLRQSIYGALWFVSDDHSLDKLRALEIAAKLAPKSNHVIDQRDSVPSSPGVWVNSVLCPFGKSVFDTLVSTHHHNDNDTITRRKEWGHYDRTLVSLHETEVTTSSAAGGRRRVNLGWDSNSQIPFGRARHCPSLGSTACPTTVQSTRDATTVLLAKKNHRQWVQLAVIGMVVSPNNNLLITRRPSHMRSFPGAWVFPGGSVDLDELLLSAVTREVAEETGLCLDHEHEWMVESIWESVYPTIPQPQVPIRHHHVVVFMSTQLTDDERNKQDDNPALKLCQDEVDGAVWLSPTDIEAILSQTLSTDTENPSLSSSSSPTVSLCQGGPSTTSDGPLRHLMGIYPQYHPPAVPGTTTSSATGLAQGSLFALQEFWQRRHPHQTIGHQPRL